MNSSAPSSTAVPVPAADPLANARRIRKLTLLLGAFAASALLIVSRSPELTLSFVAGTALVYLNLWTIEFIVERYFRPGANKSKAGGLLILKLSAMVLILYAVVRYVPVHLLAFMGGFMVFMLASLWEGLAGRTKPAANPEETK